MSKRLSFSEWICNVTDLLVKDHLEVFQESLKIYGCMSIEGLRGDEPEDCWENGETPEEYVEFLVGEWAMYGPEGE